jgi:putative ABC transport system permease protein
MSNLLKLAWQTITRHPLRSILAILAVAIGVCALTSIVSVEASWRREVMKFFAPLDMHTVKVILPAGDNWREAGFQRPRLELSDAQAIRAQCTTAQSVTSMMTGVGWAETRTSAMEVELHAVAADFTQTLPDALQSGQLFTAEQVAQRVPVCLLSHEAVDWMFGDKPAVGQPIRLEGRLFTVIGVIAGDHHIGMGKNAVYIPFGGERRLLASSSPFDPRMEIFVRGQDTGAISTQIERMMRQRLGGDGSRSFTQSLGVVRETALRSRARVTLYSSLAGLGALLAAGIGIAALLFVSVAESAREIGIRRALGATRVAIYVEYLFTSALLSICGGLIGGLMSIPAATFGAFASRWQPVMSASGAEQLLPAGTPLPTFSAMAFSVSWGALALSMVLALLIGIVAALVPASEAAEVEPARAIAQRAGMAVRPRQFLTVLQVMFGVLVLILLTSGFSFLENQDRAEARETFGQDSIFAAADPVAALRKPFDDAYQQQCRQALAAVVSAPDKMASLRWHTALLASLAPVLTHYMAVARSGSTQAPVGIHFTTAEALDYQPRLPDETRRQLARAFTDARAVAVISPSLKAKLFGPIEAIGSTITIGSRQFTVLAVHDCPLFTSGHSDNVFIPLQYYPTLGGIACLQTTSMLGVTDEARIFGRPLDTRQYDAAVMQLRDALRPLLPAAYRTTLLLSEQVPENTRQFIFQNKAVAARGALGAVAVLLVAVIGLANMLLVSVHQNIREIGIRRALGAQREDVFWRFLSEGILLSSIGAGSGLGLGLVLCWLAGAWGHLPIAISIFWAVIGTVGAIIAGVLVSIPPAVAAARIHPVEALCYE